jgi:hypothetical protein
MKLRIRPEVQGQVISRRMTPGSGVMMTLDTTHPLSQEALQRFYAHPKFTEFIEEYEDTAPRAYQGVEHPVQTEDSDSETLCTLCGTAPCQCEEPVTKPTKSRKNAKK